MNIEVRNQAFKLRRRGWSYNEINKELGVPKSTLSGWFSNFLLSDEAFKRLASRKTIGTEVLIKRNKAQTSKAKTRTLLVTRKAMGEFKSVRLTKEMLLVVGVTLYWGEGYKKAKRKNGRQLNNHPIQLTNSDPALARTFVRFLNQVMNVPLADIQLNLRIYDHINENKALEYWMKATGLPRNSHKGTTRLVSIASQRKKPYNSLPFGTVEIRMNDTERFHHLMGWLEGLKSKLAGSELLG